MTLSFALQDHQEWVASRPARSLGVWTLFVVGIGIFLELAVIRWHSSLLPVFGFYKNFSLLGAFLGLGVGYALGRRRAIHLELVVAGLFTQCFVFHGLKATGLHHLLTNPVAEELAMGLENYSGVAQQGFILAFLVFSFVVNAATFVPLGQLAAALMERQPRLTAYGWNLAGSLVGIGAFTLLSFLWTSPTIWFALLMVSVLSLFGSPLRLRGPVVVAGILFAVLAVFDPKITRYTLYSPYQALTVMPTKDESRVLISVNQLYYQKILPRVLAGQSDNPNGYEVPFLIKPRPAEVLIVGAGTGNDVAAALQSGAGHVDAVEIDPVIHRLGKELNPFMPYQSERVSSFVTDARRFLKRADRRYDMIVFGLLDSHTMLSGLSNIRLDSFVYTVESFREALALLKADGLLAITFSLIHRDLGAKLYRMLAEASGGGRVVAVQPAWHDGGVMFLAGPGLPRADLVDRRLTDVTATYASTGLNVTPSTDDWPFFYMPTKRFPGSYVVILLLLLVASVFFVRSAVLRDRGESLDLADLGVFFFLGAGFMLIEARSVTELGLLYGNTWIVVSIVIAAILAMAFAANFWVGHLPEPPAAVTAGLLGASLLLGWWLNGNAAGVPHAFYVVVAVLPLFFSGILFSSSLRHCSGLSMALAANMLGSMVGGLLEYNSMAFGFRSLYLLALALYLCAFGLLLLRGRTRIVKLAR